ncbi:LPD38 domain-containing protein [Paenibacillus chitinolyticus]|uniref:LPD38 domain-containing protein n=1 Tax=Paenibacillus chitinolyticus TaxID=79263 RepID=UPI0036D86F79
MSQSLRDYFSRNQSKGKDKKSLEDYAKIVDDYQKTGALPQKKQEGSFLDVYKQVYNQMNPPTVISKSVGAVKDSVSKLQDVVSGAGLIADQLGLKELSQAQAAEAGRNSVFKARELIKDIIPNPKYVNEARRSELDPENSVLKAIKHNTVDVLGKVGDSFLYDTVPGKVVQNFNQGASATMGAPMPYPAQSTGSKVGDIASQIAGVIGGFAVNPAQLEQNVPALFFSGPRLGYAVNKTTDLGNYFLNKTPVSTRIPTLTGVPRLMAQEALGAAAYEAPRTLMTGGEFSDIPERMAYAGAYGAAGGAVLGGLGAGIKALGRRISPSPSQQPMLALPEPRPSAITSERPTANLDDWFNNPIKSKNELPSFSDFAKRIEAEELGGAAKSQGELTPLKLMDDLPEAQPAKQDMFTDLFGQQGLGITPFGSTKQISKDPLTTAGQIVSKPIKNDIEGISAKLKDTGRAAIHNFVDYLRPLKKISQDVYDKSIDASRANNIANTIVHDKFVNPQGEVLGDGLKEIFDRVARGKTKDFLDYLVLRHSKTRMERGERVYSDNLGMTPEKAQQRIMELERRNPDFANNGMAWDKFNENMLKTYGVDEGLISREAFNYLREQNPNYTPMRREFTRSEKFSSAFTMGAKPAFSGQKAPIKQVSPTGSVRNIVDPRRSIIEATGAWVNAAMRNRVMQGVVQKIQANPEAMKALAEIVPETSEATQKSLKEINDVIKSDGMEGLLEKLNGDFDVLFKKAAQKGGTENIVQAMVDGNPVKIKIHDPEAFKALVGLGAEQSNLILDIFGKLSNATKHGATGVLAPMFAVKGLTTDVGQALIQSKAPVWHVWDLMHAMISSVADRTPKGTPGLDNIRALAQDFRRVGGEYSAALKGDRQLNKRVGSLDRNAILSPKGITRAAGKTALMPFKVLQGVADITENANRMAAYKGSLRSQGGVRSPETIRNALQESREITTNFSRRGSQSQTIEKFIPYQNAAVQGVYRLAKAFKDTPIKTTAMVGGVVLLPKFLEYTKFHDDPDYQNIPARELYRNVIVNKNADGTFSKVPMAQEYIWLGALMVDLLSKFRDNDPQAFKGTSDAVSNAVLPPLLNGLMQGVTQGGGIEKSLGGFANSLSTAPFSALISNQSFTGAPIVPKRLEDRSPQYQYDEKTSGLAKFIGEKLNMAPVKVDYLIRAYGGDPARLLLPLTSDVGAGTPRNTLLKNFIADPVFTNNLSNDFFDAKQKLTNANKDNKDVNAPLPSWYTEEAYKLVSSQSKGSPSKMLTDLNNQKRDINSDKTLSAESKAQKLRTIQEQINNIYLDVNSKLRKAGVPMENR